MIWLQRSTWNQLCNKLHLFIGEQRYLSRLQVSRLGHEEKLRVNLLTVVTSTIPRACTWWTQEQRTNISNLFVITHRINFTACSRRFHAIKSSVEVHSFTNIQYYFCSNKTLISLCQSSIIFCLWKLSPISLSSECLQSKKKPLEREKFAGGKKM